MMKTEKRMIITVAVIAIMIGSVGAYIYIAQMGQKETLTISTTTSLYDTGLLDALKTAYEEKHPNVVLAFIAAGTGIALEQAKNGDADMILVHAPSLEQEFMEEGYGVNRKVFAYNFFVVVGPKSDPAQINQSSPVTALQKIYAYGHAHNTSLWVSRDDNSGTNTKEKALWAAAGFNYTIIHDEPWFVSSGTGMGTTLNIANERGLYTLSDIGTFLKYRADGLIDLQNLVQDDKTLLNVYSAMAVNKTIITHAKIDIAMEFIKYLVSDEGQELIGGYGNETFDTPLFYPAVKVIKTHSPTDIANWIEDYAFFDVGGIRYECPPKWRYGVYGVYP
ncbi:MAG: substrate-binding domain-containing protein [Candidatus Thorarchaeota archaeon]